MSAPATRPRERRGDRWIALALAVLATAVLVRAGRGEGFNRDESTYVDAAEMYYAWYAGIGDALTDSKPWPALRKAVSQESRDRWFGENHEHPALWKTLFGFSWRILHTCDCPKQMARHRVASAKPHRTLGLLGDTEAMRFPADLAGGLTVALAFLFGARAFSRRAGLVAAVLALAAPRMFFHAQLACFDAPMATAWLAAVYCWWRSLDDRRWAWRAGLALGLAIATKHNGFFLPFLFLAHYLWLHRGTMLGPSSGAGLARRVPPIPLAFVWMAVLAPLVEFAHWPWLWADTARRFGDYLGFHLHHVYYNMEFLGTNYNKPPFPKSYAFVMTLLTAPVTTLALALAGSVALLAAPRASVADPIDRAVARPGWKEPARGIDPASGALIGLNALFPLFIIAFTGAPIFGATKHWLAAIPFLALLGGRGLDALAGTVEELLGLRGAARAAFATGSVILACAPAIAETVRSHPYGLSHYNLLAGGPAGGADLGMNRQFWGYSTRGVLPWLNQHAPPGAQIYWHDTHQGMLNLDVRAGLLREDLGNTGLEEPGVKASSLAMVIHEKHFNEYEYWIWDFYGTARPSFVLTDEGVPIVTVYQRPTAGALRTP